MKTNKLFYLLAIAFAITACEDVIDVDLDEGRNQLVIDAFVTSDSSIQTIRLTQSAPYFSNVRTPSENSATVVINGPNGVQYSFVSDNNGNHNFTIFPITENGEGAHNYINFEDVLSELSYWCYNQPPFINFANLNKEAEVKNNHVDFNRHDRLPKYKTSFRSKNDIYIKELRNLDTYITRLETYVQQYFNGFNQGTQNLNTIHTNIANTIQTILINYYSNNNSSLKRNRHLLELYTIHNLMARSMSHNSIGRSYTNNRGRFYGIRTRFQNAIYAIKINLLHKNIDFLNITGGLPDDDHRAHKRNFYGNC